MVDESKRQVLEDFGKSREQSARAIPQTTAESCSETLGGTI